MTFQVQTSRKFRRAARKLDTVDKNKARVLKEVIRLLATGLPLPVQYKDHRLKGNMNHLRECHIAPDLLLVYERDQKDLTVALVNIGSHSYLFG